MGCDSNGRRKAAYLWFSFVPFYLRNGKAAREQEWRDDLFKLCIFFSLDVKSLGSSVELVLGS